MFGRIQFTALIVFAYALLPFPWLRRSRKAVGPDPRILIVQTGKIGDLVCTTPIFRCIKRAWPGSQLGVAVTALAAPVLEGNRHVDDVWRLHSNTSLVGTLRLIRGVRQRGYTWALVLTPAPVGILIAYLAGIPNRALTVIPEVPRLLRSVLLLANRYVPYQLRTSGFAHYCRMLALTGSVQCDERRELFPSAAAQTKAREFLLGHGITADRFSVGISVTAGKRNKEWPPDRFAALADRLAASYGASIIWVGSAADRPLIDEVQASMRHRDRACSSAGEFVLAELPALLGALKLFIGVDTGPVYMADAVGVPVVDIAGPADTRSQAPIGKFAIVQSSVLTPRLTLMAAPDSSERDPAIMAITVEQVWGVVKDFISREQLAAPRA
ncbi:glycosyltransferase family 9 protein [Candidatus Parcubacteria bacterium]|nr:glycosyltransferase family 9 protein [Candidatus Parcubacteria bacterium]MBI4385254.1 glycosyltransferase family 9 protein [Candidatus Parcubacteria bacterium]